MRVESTDGVAIELHDLGGDGPPLLIAHATGFCVGPYRPLAAGLGERFHVYALDFRGHGLSGRPADGNFSWTAMTDDALACIDQIRGSSDEPILAFGHSMGGACLMLAELRRPGTLRAAWVFEPIVIPDRFAKEEPGENFLAESARRRRPTFDSRQAALYRYASRPPLGALRADALWHYVEEGFRDLPDGTATLRLDTTDEAAVFEATGKPLASQLAGVDVPVTLAIGEADPGPGPADFGRHAVTFLPKGSLHPYSHLGHFGPLQDPTEIAKDIIEAFDDFA